MIKYYVIITVIILMRLKLSKHLGTVIVLNCLGALSIVIDT